MKISLRTPEGWSDNEPNRNDEVCDQDGEKLMVAPHGGLYCNAMHAPAHVHEYIPQMGVWDEETGEPVGMCTVDDCYAYEPDEKEAPEESGSASLEDTRNARRFDALGQPRG